MKNATQSELFLEVSLRDAQIFQNILSDCRELFNKFEQEGSCNFLFRGSSEECEQLMDEVRDLVCCCGELLELNFVIDGEDLY